MDGKIKPITRPGGNEDRKDKKMTAKWIIENGYYEAAVNLMDDEIREELHNEMAPCTDLEFLEAYMKRHEEKYGEEFEI